MNNGYVVYDGHSTWDGAPVVAIATGFVTPSDNPKTGPMIQLGLYRKDIPPHVAVMTGQDRSVCGHCPLRQHTVKARMELDKVPPGKKDIMCYVTTSNGPRGTWNAFKDGLYPYHAEPRLLYRGRDVRGGSYGNLSQADYSVTEDIVRGSRSYTLYDHNWAYDFAQPWREFAMASVSTLADKGQANRMGWATFRVSRDDHVEPDEIRCPASEEAGKRLQCIRCRLCCGWRSKGRRNGRPINIVIQDHGPTSALQAKKISAARKASAARRVALGVI